MKNRIREAFLAIVRAGLWEKEVRLSQYNDIDFSAIYKLAEEQSVVGLCAAGLEQVSDVIVPQNVALEFAGTALLLEQRNKEMNAFLGSLYGQLQRMGIYAILVKGQGIAQSYERPLLRAAGDIDLLLSDSNYTNAKEWLDSNGQRIEDEHKYKKRIEYLVDSWHVELHGTMRGELGGRIDKVIDEVQKGVFYGGNVRSWMNGNTQVFLPSPDNDMIFVFAHILQHFYRGGIGLRQICDWCRLLWTYHNSLNHGLLESRISKMGVMTEWKSFGTLAVNVLGMPVEAMPLYSEKRKYVRKAQRLCDIVMSSGNFGYNRDQSYKAKSSFFVRMVISLYYRTYDFVHQAMVFPGNACRAFIGVWKTGIGVVSKRIKK